MSSTVIGSEGPYTQRFSLWDDRELFVASYKKFTPDRVNGGPNLTMVQRCD